MLHEVSDDDKTIIYEWIDKISLSREKGDISRDFSDGVLMAEVIHHYFPHIVDLHNYSQQNSFDKKMYNWEHLQRLFISYFFIECFPRESFR
jgi:hypothetical protein